MKIFFCRRSKYQNIKLPSVPDGYNSPKPSRKIQKNMTRYHNTERHHTVPHNTIHHNTPQTPYSTQHHTTAHSTLIHDTTQHCTTLYTYTIILTFSTYDTQYTNTSPLNIFLCDKMSFRVPMPISFLYSVQIFIYVRISTHNSNANIRFLKGRFSHLF